MRSPRRSRAATPINLLIDAHAAEMAAALQVFEALLDGLLDFLGDELLVADCIGIPFLKYAAGRDPADDDLFHRVLEDYQQLGDAHPNLAALYRAGEPRRRGALP